MLFLVYLCLYLPTSTWSTGHKLDISILNSTHIVSYLYSHVCIYLPVRKVQVINSIYRYRIVPILYLTCTGWFKIIVGVSVGYHFQTRNNKVKLLTEYESVNQKVLISIESILQNAKQLQHARLSWHVRCPSGIQFPCKCSPFAV
jgi:hypothetical protein